MPAPPAPPLALREASSSRRSPTSSGCTFAPPANPIVLCIDEKSHIQALDRTAPMLPMQPRIPERRTHDYKRHGTTTLFAALEIATGKVTGRCQPRHRHQEFLRFLKPRHLRLGQRPQRQDPRLHRRLERPLPPLHMDQDRQPDSRQSQASNDY
jgi:hypothetical protein